jgi:hypothetical protein
MRWKLVAGFLLVASRVFAQPALYPGTNTNFVTGQGVAGAITRWTSQGVIAAGSLTDSAAQANKSVCFADGTGARPVLNCGDAGIKYTKGSSPTLNLGVNGQYQINGVNVLGGGSFSLQERAAPAGVPGYDLLWADSTAHHLKQNNNNGAAIFVLGAPTQGTATTVLHGNASGDPSFSAVNLATDVTGNLPVANLGGGTGADADHFWSGTGVWSLPIALQFSSRSGTTNLNTGATNYLITVGSLAASLTEGDVQLTTTQAKAAHLGCYLPVAAPGGGKSWTITLRKNGVDTASTCPIADAASSCSDDTNVVSFVGGDLVSIKIVPAGTPTASTILCGFLMYGAL